MAGSSRSAGPRTRKRRRRILKRFVQLCGGRDADIAIIPTASRLPDTGAALRGTVRPARGRARAVARFRHPRATAERDDYLRRLETATGIFFTGGNQLRISTILGGTPVGAADPRAQRATACTSPAPAPAPHPQRAHDRVRQGRLVAARRQRAPGAGPGADQPLHHRPAFPPARPPRPPARGAGLQPVRDRHRPRRGHRGLHRPGRHAGGRRQRRGHRGRCRRHCSSPRWPTPSQSEPVCLLGLTVHILVAGATFNLHTRRASPGTLVADKS